MKRGNIRKSLTEGSQRIREHNLKTRKVKARYHLKIRVVSLQKRRKMKKKKKINPRRTVSALSVF